MSEQSSFSSLLIATFFILSSTSKIIVYNSTQEKLVGVQGQSGKLQNFNWIKFVWTQKFISSKHFPASRVLPRWVRNFVSHALLAFEFESQKREANKILVQSSAVFVGLSVTSLVDVRESGFSSRIHRQLHRSSSAFLLHIHHQDRSCRNIVVSLRHEKV